MIDENRMKTPIKLLFLRLFSINLGFSLKSEGRDENEQKAVVLGLVGMGLEWRRLRQLQQKRIQRLQ